MATKHSKFLDFFKTFCFVNFNFNFNFILDGEETVRNTLDEDRFKSKVDR